MLAFLTKHWFLLLLLGLALTVPYLVWLYSHECGVVQALVYGPDGLECVSYSHCQ